MPTDTTQHRPDSGASDCLVSVDVETAGAVPAQHSLLSIGACLVDDPDQTFYAELRPEHPDADPEALAVSGLSMKTLTAAGLAATEALAAFDAWLAEVVPAGHRPVLLAFNAPFDWMFLADAFARHLGRNPFGHAALDVKAFAMGALGCSWSETSMRHLSPRYLSGRQLGHHALDDARDQAELFRRIRAERAGSPPTPDLRTVP